MHLQTLKAAYILFGVDDDKKIVGVESEKETTELVKDTALNYCEPPLDFTIEYKEIKGKEIVIVFVPESNNKPHRLQDYQSDFDITTATVTIRVNDKSVQASKEMIRILTCAIKSDRIKKICSWS